MLSKHHCEIVKATVPVLEVNGEILTHHFYAMMLQEYPEVRPLFNQANQASGEQSRALANGILMYARHIDHLDQLGSLVATIVNKHVGLQVQPEHYPIVGNCLLRSIREVLGSEIATDDVITAWGAAYQQLAGIMIDAEARLYDANAQREGGWRGGRTFIVQRREEESREITSFYLEPADNGAIASFEPGQYIGLRVFIDGEEHRRNYSLSAPPNGWEYRISVKRHVSGRVSRYLHDQLQCGATLELFPPVGLFVLRSGARPVVFITGGVGITPVLPMLEQALINGREVWFIHAARDASVHAFGPWIDSLCRRWPQLHRFYIYQHGNADASGLLQQHHLERWLPANPDLDVYFLGPQPFMRAVKQQLTAIGVPTGQIYYEFFGPASVLLD